MTIARLKALAFMRSASTLEVTSLSGFGSGRKLTIPFQKERTPSCRANLVLGAPKERRALSA